ncbi:DUF2630 family protein [Streptomyces sp. NPDC001093]|uniref:DUF2630 family protein n=1 Tax=Streptomyces sp. NPDC001093 TaxID=3154376 RepID=UPI0033213781
MPGALRRPPAGHGPARRVAARTGPGGLRPDALLPALDRCWDLLRQRRAKAEWATGADRRAESDLRQQCEVRSGRDRARRRKGLATAPSA